MNNLEVKNTEHARIPEWMRICGGLRRKDHDVGLRPGIDDVLVASHVVRGKIDAHCLDRINFVLNNLHGVSLRIGELCFIAIEVTVEQPRKEVVFEFGDKALREMVSTQGSHTRSTLTFLAGSLPCVNFNR
jgi:hypothetical protein